MVGLECHLPGTPLEVRQGTPLEMNQGAPLEIGQGQVWCVGATKGAVGGNHWLDGLGIIKALLVSGYQVHA